MNEMQQGVLDYLKTKPDGASVWHVVRHCYLSYPAAYTNLEALFALGVLGKTFVKSRAWYKFVREL